MLYRMLHFLHSRLVYKTSSGKAEYAVIALIIVVVLQSCALFAVRRGFAARVFEASAGISTAAACVFTLMIRGTYFPRQVISTVLVTLWGLRLSYYLFKRGRFYSLEKVNVLSRMFWSVLCALPTVVANTKQTEVYRSTAVELVCIVSALLCLGLENRADAQKLRWHARYADAPNIPELQRPGRGSNIPPVCSSGLWTLSRHINIFFDLSFHWCIFFILRPIEEPFIVVCPLTLTLFVLFLPGGVAMHEIYRNTRFDLYPAYVLYKQETPVFFPLPGLYRALAIAPNFRKHVCLDLDLYDEKL